MVDHKELINACTEGDIENVRKLLASGVNKNVKELLSDMSALMIAIVKKHYEIAELLIKAGADVNNKDTDGKTPLILATELGLDNIVQSLINAGADVNAQNKDGATALIIASSWGRSEISNSLIQAGSNVNAQNKDGDTALILTANIGYDEIAKSLIQAGANVNAQNKDGDTALIIASKKGYYKVVDQLLTAGAKVDIKNKNQKTALNFVKNPKIKNLLNEAFKFNNISGDEKLINACIHGNIEQVEQLIKEGEDINFYNKQGVSPLIAAAYCGHKEIVDMLLKNKVDINAKNNNQNTALIWAAYKNHTEVVKTLVKAGADVIAKNKDKKTAFDLTKSEDIKNYLEKFNIIEKHIESNNEKLLKETIQLSDDKNNELKTFAIITALKKKNFRIVSDLLNEYQQDQMNLENYIEKDKNISPNDKLLLGAIKGDQNIFKNAFRDGADINTKDVDGKTPLIWAASNGHVEVVKKLLEQKADVQSKARFGNTALSWAAYNGHTEVAELLIEKGANINQIGQNGKTPLHRAIEQNHIDVAKLLIKKGANLNQIDQDGKTPLHKAIEKGHKDLVKLLIENGADYNIKDNKNKKSALEMLVTKEDLLQLSSLNEPVMGVVVENSQETNPSTRSNRLPDFEYDSEPRYIPFPGDTNQTNSLRTNPLLNTTITDARDQQQSLPTASPTNTEAKKGSRLP